MATRNEKLVIGGMIALAVIGTAFGLYAGHREKSLRAKQPAVEQIQKDNARQNGRSDDGYRAPGKKTIVEG